MIFDACCRPPLGGCRVRHHRRVYRNRGLRRAKAPPARVIIATAAPAARPPPEGRQDAGVTTTLIGMRVLDVRARRFGDLGIFCNCFFLIFFYDR